MTADTLATNARPLRIVLVTELRGKGDEGMRVWLRQFERVMAGAGHHVERHVLEGNPRVGAADPRNLRRLAAAKPDVIQYVPYSGLTSAALLRMRTLGLAVPSALRSIAVLQAGQDDLSGARAHVALFASQRLAASAGDFAARTAVVYPVIDARFSPGPVDRAAIRARLGVQGDKPMVLHVGHLKASRNLSVLGDLAATGRYAVVMVASTSTEADPEVRADLEARGVTVFRDFLPDIEQVYRAADLYVFPVQDALGSIEVPLSVVEARSCGVPVLTTRFGALPELFEEGGLINYAEPPAFAERVPAILASGAPAEDPNRDELAVFGPEEFVARVEAALARPARAVQNGSAPMIVLSGVDGAGKSTQIERLVSDFSAQGVQVDTLWCRWDPLIVKPAVNLLGWLSRKRGGTPAADDAAPQAAAGTVPEKRRNIRRKLLDNGAFALLWRGLMVVDYGVRLAPKVRAARRRNQVVLLDRYWHDVMVDYSYGRDLQEPPRALRSLLPEPDGMVILDVPEEIALQRKSDTPDVQYLTERRRLYHEVAERYDGTIVDASRPADEVFTDVAARVRAIAGRPPRA